MACCPSRVVSLVMLSTLAPSPPGRPTPPSAREVIDSLVHRVVERVPGVPGVAVAVVRDTGTVYLGAAGYRDIEAGLPATPATPYYIASSTKSFTGMAASLLAARGVLDLDAPLSRYLPEARLPAARSADSVTLRQLLTHSMGFSNRAIVIRTAYTGEHTDAQLIDLLRDSKVTDRVFHYDNLGYVVAGLVLDRVTGKPWQEVLDSAIFSPLGMRHTTAYMSRAHGWGVAVPYLGGVDSLPRRLPMTKRDETMHPAGGMVSSAADLARWLEANLNGGRLEGRQVLDAVALQEAHRLQVRLPEAVEFGPFRRFGYGLGWYWGTYDGDTLLHHFGGYQGARAHLSFMPAHHTGVVVLLNASGPVADVADLIATAAYDVVLGKPDAAARFDSALAETERQIAEAREGAARARAEIAARPSTLSRAAQDYAGVYRSRALGTIRVRFEDERLRLTLGPLDGFAGYYTRPDAVRVEFSPGEGRVVQFFTSSRGVDSLEFAGYVFRAER